MIDLWSVFLYQATEPKMKPAQEQTRNGIEAVPTMEAENAAPASPNITADVVPEIIDPRKY